MTDITLNNKLKDANKTLNINNALPIIFVYTAPKVGSTSMVSSLRVFGIDKFNIIHVHDELMLSVLSDICDVSINDIIKYNATIGNLVYVIDIYRNPIEHKISYFFEHIGYHFNNTDEKINSYTLSRVVKRFNQIFPFINTANYFLSKYNLPADVPAFNFSDKYTHITHDGVHYIALRLADSAMWGEILHKTIGCQVKCIKDYETKHKPISHIYNLFMHTYNIPDNFIQLIENDVSLKYFLSQKEQEDYINTWKQKMLGKTFEPFDLRQYDMYNEITIENAQFTQIQHNHYLDDGCKCNACVSKRQFIARAVLNGTYTGETNHHINSNKEFKERKINAFCSRMKRINSRATASISTNKAISKKIMTNIVGKR